MRILALTSVAARLPLNTLYRAVVSTLCIDRAFRQPIDRSTSPILKPTPTQPSELSRQTDPHYRTAANENALQQKGV
ncbi:MAG: hypothetical protein J7641_01920 [Cyanobacteria bacterium SID2]|nr:hypothetical protein [Cyanobacteria bacterium SID2]MBP0003106.1 hypothetical protein [Cyanobacteria bacterium SBC]